MRRGYNCDFIYDENQKVIGFDLGYDFCAEHECGIEDIKRGFGIPIDYKEKPFSSWWKSILGLDKPIMGVEKRSITKCPETIIKGEGVVKWSDYSKKPIKRDSKKVYFIGYKPYFLSSQSDPTNIFSDYLKQIYDAEKSHVWGWWSEDDFMVASTNKEFIDEMYEAFQNKDVVIMVGGNGGNPFKNRGLCLIKKSLIPEEVVKMFLERDEDKWNLEKAAVSTGIYDRLEKAKKSFYALSPRWKDETKKDVVFWLNPQNQSQYSSGWYSVENLDMWAKDQGPVVEKKQKK